MSKCEENILKNGLKFCPTPQSTNKLQESMDMEEFCRKMKLMEYFHDTSLEDISLVKPKSNFVPPTERSNVLDSTVAYLKNLPPPTKNDKINYNIKLNERKALTELSNNLDITIKEADKGAAVVLMDSELYKLIIENLLSNTVAYEKLPANIDNKIMNKLTKLVNLYKNELTEKEVKYLTQFEFKSSYFYGLPKIHKSQYIMNAIKAQNTEVIQLNMPDDLCFRPIVAGPSCPTRRLSHLIDRLLQPFLPLIPSYIKDSIDALNKLPETVNDSAILVTVDIEGLYNNITHNLGLTALSFWINKFPNIIDRISLSFIIESTKFILENNTFIFNRDHYRQLMGTAMGTKFAPAYAALCLGYLEDKLYKQLDTRFCDSISTQFKNNYKRFLDDILMVLDEKHMQVEDILNLLNNLDN